MRQALTPLLFDDDDLDEDRWRRDPVAPARQSESALAKKVRSRRNGDTPAYCFRTLLAELATCCRNRCRLKSGPDLEVSRLTQRNQLQERALELLKLLPVHDGR